MITSRRLLIERYLNPLMDSGCWRRSDPVDRTMECDGIEPNLADRLFAWRGVPTFGADNFVGLATRSPVENWRAFSVARTC
jgi:hypothetical protein